MRQQDRRPVPPAPGAPAASGTPEAADRPPPPLCDYLAAAVCQRLTRMLMYVEGVRDGRDPEAVHQMRVWSRRTRVALDAVERCGGTGCAEAEGRAERKRFRAFSRDVKRVTRALGAVRDLDVMMVSLERAAAGLPDAQRSGVEGLLARLRAERQSLQDAAAAAAKQFERSEPLGAWRELAGCGSATGAAAGPGPLAEAERVISGRLDDLLAFAPVAERPECVAELHAMRVAAKRLRYAMELFRDLYRDHTAHGPAFAAAIRDVEEIQERLGAIHDADVLAPALLGALAALVAPGCGMDDAGLPVAGTHRVDLEAAQGLLTLCAEARDRRDAEYAAFRRHWHDLLLERRAFTALGQLLNGAAEQTAAAAGAAAAAPAALPDGRAE